jgi:hypothetical protein
MIYIIQTLFGITGSESVITEKVRLQSKFRIRIRKIRLFLGLPYSDPDPLVRLTAPGPDPSIIKQK